MEEGQEAHWEVVQRILFLYAKLNPGQSYVQGMNEIVGPIYYVMASDPDPDYRGGFCSQWYFFYVYYYTFLTNRLKNMLKLIVSFALRLLWLKCAIFL